MLTAKYGVQYAEACRVESVDTISEKLKHKLSIHSPPKLLVEKYMIEIAKCFDVPYEPDPQVMQEDRGTYCVICQCFIYDYGFTSGKDALLIDLSDRNNLGGIPQPPGFLGYPQPPTIPEFPNAPTAPFSYPVTHKILLSYVVSYFVYSLAAKR